MMMSLIGYCCTTPRVSLSPILRPKPVNRWRYHENRVPTTGILGELDFTMVRNEIMTCTFMFVAEP